MITAYFIRGIAWLSGAWAHLVCRLVGHDTVRGPPSAAIVHLRNYSIDGVIRCRYAHANVWSVTCARCSAKLPDGVLILGPVDTEGDVA